MPEKSLLDEDQFPFLADPKCVPDRSMVRGVKILIVEELPGLNGEFQQNFLSLPTFQAQGKKARPLGLKVGREKDEKENQRENPPKHQNFFLRRGQ
jgi:hypothetical protein